MIAARRPILLAEDDPRDSELVLSVLERRGLAGLVVRVEDGVQALDFLHRRGEFAGRPGGDPRVVLLDLKMPRLGGLEVLREMTAVPRLREIPVVVLSSSREPRDLAQCYRLRANAYVVKPTEFGEFRRCLETLGEFWGERNEPPLG